MHDIFFFRVTCFFSAHWTWVNFFFDRWSCHEFIFLVQEYLQDLFPSLSHPTPPQKSNGPPLRWSETMLIQVFLLIAVFDCHWRLIWRYHRRKGCRPDWSKIYDHRWRNTFRGGMAFDFLCKEPSNAVLWQNFHRCRMWHRDISCFGEF